MVKVMRSYRMSPTTMMFLEQMKMENPGKSETDIVEEAIEQVYVLRHHSEGASLLEAWYRVRKRMEQPSEEEVAAVGAGSS